MARLDVIDLVTKVADFNTQIMSLIEQRDAVIKSHESGILSEICRMMDWETCDIERHHIRYGSLEKRVMIEIIIKSDKNARYVFELGKSGKFQLKFREDFTKDPYHWL